jgi:hypothetical protein
VSEVGVIPHYMPQYGPVSQVNQGLGHILIAFPDPHTQPAAKKDYLHQNYLPELI